MRENHSDSDPSLLRAAIDAEKQRVEVDPYYTVAMNKGLKGHAMGYWSGTLMGLLTGALCGGIMAVCGFTFGLPALAIVGGVAGIGGVAGGTVGSRVGSSAGTVSGVIEEKERRERADKLEQEILQSPEKQREAIAKFKANPVVEKSNTVGEAFSTMPAHKAMGQLIDLKTMPMTILLCGLAGMAMFGGVFAATGAINFLGIAVSNLAAAVGLGAALGAGVGVSFGINYPMIFASLTKGVGDLLSGKMMRGDSGHEPVKQQKKDTQQVAMPAVAEPQPLRRDGVEQPSSRVSDMEWMGHMLAFRAAMSR